MIPGEEVTFVAKSPREASDCFHPNGVDPFGLLHQQDLASHLLYCEQLRVIFNLMAADQLSRIKLGVVWQAAHFFAIPSIDWILLLLFRIGFRYICV